MTLNTIPPIYTTSWISCSKPHTAVSAVSRHRFAASNLALLTSASCKGCEVLSDPEVSSSRGEQNLMIFSVAISRPLEIRTQRYLFFVGQW
jgi:hypothetical protein